MIHLVERKNKSYLFQPITLTVMIALSDFADFTIQEQAQYVWDQGEYILSRTEKHYTFCLYRVNTFFIEVWYNHEQERISQFILLSSFVRLDAYLKVISLKGLFV
jgi:hypothetical protein